MRSASWLAVGILPIWLQGCGDHGSGAPAPTLASASDAAIVDTLHGVTPFISFAELRGKALGGVTTVTYRIDPRPGTSSRPVSVQRTVDALRRRGFADGNANAITLPVFGLYADFSNHVSIDLTFSDASTQSLSVDIAAPAYVDPNGVYDHMTILKSRGAGDSLGFDFFAMKSGLGSPVVVDSDGYVRWVGSFASSATTSTFESLGFLVGDAASTSLHRLELDGSSSEMQVSSPVYTKFHHNIDPGKVGLLVEMDSTANGVSNVESTLTEITDSGVVLKEWDLAAILSEYMRNAGDDPTAFVRPGIDWFHLNGSVYDPRDDSVIVSSRENFLIKLDYATGEIRWILGDPTKYWYTFASLRAKALLLEQGGLYPIGQHAPSITSDGLLMIFNDGGQSSFQPTGAPAGEERTFSAVSAYDIHPDSLSATEAWRFDYAETIFSDVCSSAYEAGSSKSILVTYAVAEARAKARLVGLDGSKNVVFDFEYANSKGPCTTSWNAIPVSFDALREQ